jgi:hypothetical protein
MVSEPLTTVPTILKAGGSSLFFFFEMIKKPTEALFTKKLPAVTLISHFSFLN